ncbi:hypothetical protein D3C73_1101820 [compost metagenome]
MAGQAVLDALDEVVLAELSWADVHAEAELQGVDQALGNQLPEGIARFVDDPGTDFEDQAAVFQHLDEFCGGLRTQFRVIPAHQRFGTDDAIVSRVDLGLEMHIEFAPGKGQAQVGFHAQAFAGSLLHGVVIHLCGIAP